MYCYLLTFLDGFVSFSDLKIVHSFGVGFFADSAPGTHRLDRRKRQLGGLENQAAVAQRTVAEPSFLKRTVRPEDKRENRLRCSLKSLYVDFKDLGWDVSALRKWASDFRVGSSRPPAIRLITATDSAASRWTPHSRPPTTPWSRPWCTCSTARGESVIFWFGHKASQSRMECLLSTQQKLSQKKLN